MPNILFNDEQQKQLRTNHQVKLVTEKLISFLGDYKNYIAISIFLVIMVPVFI